MTLKAYSQEQEKIAAYVEARDQQFDQLRQDIHTRALRKYTDADIIQEKYGPPIYKKTLDRPDGVKQEWLYRYATRFFGSPKVYLYFDRERSLVGWDMMETGP